MSVYKKLRAMTASSISEIELEDSFVYCKWLKHSVTEEIKIEQIFSHLTDIGNIKLDFDKPVSNDFRFNFHKIKLYKSNPKKLELKTRTNPVFFGLGKIPTRDIDFQFDKDLKQQFTALIVSDDGAAVSLSIKELKRKGTTKKLSPDITNITVDIVDQAGKSVQTKKINFTSGQTPSRLISYNIGKVEIVIPDYHIPLPVVKDYLSGIVPKVYNIRLLELKNVEGEKQDAEKFQQRIDLLDNSPKLKEIIHVQINPADKILEPISNFDFNIHLDSRKYFKELLKIKIAGTKIKSFSIAQASDPRLFIQYDGNSIKAKGPGWITAKEQLSNINKILQPVIEITDEEKRDITNKFYPYQIEGADFLLEHKTAVLNDELGMGKSAQAIAAIKILFRKKEIKSVLIITNRNFIGDRAIFRSTGSFSGWEGEFQKFAPGITTIQLDNNKNKIKSLFEKQSQVYIVSYQLINELIFAEILTEKKLSIFDCIVYDDIELIGGHETKLNRLLKLFHAKYSWFLSCQPKSVLEEKIGSKLLPEYYLRRRKEDISEQLPDLVRQDIWFDLNDQQSKEYEQALFYAQSQLLDVLETGNPYRFQAKVFFSLHQLKQITNFPAANINSHKADLLILQLTALKNSGQQAVIFSQYDKFGTQKLMELFKKEKIKHVCFLPGMSPDESEDVIRKFEKDKSITVLIAGMQATLSKQHLTNASYIIHLDQWWVPTTQWNLDEKINGIDGSKSTINVYAYFTKNTVEEKLRNILLQNGLLIENFTATLGAEAFTKLITENEWLEIFNLPIDEARKIEQEAPLELLKKLTPKKLLEKVQLLFFNVGYKNIKIEDNVSDNVYILRGTYTKKSHKINTIVQCIFNAKKISYSEINNFIKSINDEENVQKIFIFTLFPIKDDPNHKFSAENVTIINVEQLAIYLRLFELI